MDTQMKDICGTPFAIGDLVATDVMSYKQSSLRVGTVTAFDGTWVTVQYELAPPSWRRGAKPRKQSVTRRPTGVVKVDRPEVTNG